MIIYFVSVIAALITALAGVFYIRAYYKQKDIAVSAAEFKLNMLLIPAISVVLALFIVFSYKIQGISEIYTIKRVTLIVFLLLCAVPDIKAKLIPNKLILAAVLFWLLESAIGWVLEPKLIFEDIVSSVIGAVFGGGLLFLGRLISKNGMGMGDIKLMLMAGLYTKFDGMFGLMFWSLIIALIWGVCLIILKKAKLKTTMSMAPFFFTGAVVTDVMLFISAFNV